MNACALTSDAASLASGVSLTSPAFVGSHTLYYLDSSTVDRTLTAWDENGTTIYASGVSEYRVRATPSTVYFSIDPTEVPAGYAAGVYAAAVH